MPIEPNEQRKGVGQLKREMALVTALALLLCAAPAAAAERASVSVEGLWLGVTGVDSFPGAAGTYGESDYDVWYWSGDFYEEELYAYEGDEVILSPAPAGAVGGLTFKLEAFLPSARNGWLRPGLRLSYWSTSGAASADGEGAGYGEELVDWGSEDLDSDGYDDEWEIWETSAYGATMWDEYFSSYAWYDLELTTMMQDGYDDWWETDYAYTGYYEPDDVTTSWYAGSSFASSDLEALLEFPVVEEDSAYFALLGGAKYATWKHSEEMGVSGEFINDDDEFTEYHPYEGTPYYHYVSDYYYDYWDLDSTASVSLAGIGPCVGAFGRVRMSDWLSFTAKATYAYVLGNASLEGLFTDRDEWYDEVYQEWGYWNGEAWVSTESETDEDSGTMYGEVPLSASLAMSLGILDYQVALEAEFGNFFAAVGYFGSTWLGVPLAPAFSYPLVEWDLSRRTTVNFGGPGVKVGIRF